MKPKILIFDLNTLVDIPISYSTVLASLSSLSGRVWEPGTNLFSALSLLRSQMDAAQYSELERQILPLMEKVELEQAGQARLRWGVKEGLDSLEATKLKLALITDLSKSAAEKIIEEQSLKKYFTALAARSKEGPPRDLKQQVDTILKESRLKVGNVLLVTGSPAMVREAKAAGIRVVALPLEGINVRALVDAKPDALLLNLQELRDMLALEGFPLPGEQTDK